MLNDCTVKASATARVWMDMKPVFLDTETTGLGGDAEIIDLAIVNYDGEILFNRLIKPLRPISPEATNIHHITNEMVNDCDYLGAYSGKIKKCLDGRVIIAYNAAYDIRMIAQSWELQNLRWSPSWLGALDAMQLYAEFYGDFDPKWQKWAWQKWAWQKLGAAARQCGVPCPEGEFHRSLPDTLVTREIMLYMGRFTLET